MKIPLISNLPSFLGVDFRNTEYVMGLGLSHKGLIEPASKRKAGGRKVMKEYLMPNEEAKVAVCIEFEDVKCLNPEELPIDRNYEVSSISEATHIRKVCKWFFEDGTVYTSKTEYELIKNKKKLIKVRVDYAIDYLQDTAEKLGAGEAVAFIFNGFKSGFDNWKDLGNGSLFLAQLRGEKQETLNTQNITKLYGTVNAEIPNFAPKTFNDALVEQITGVKWVAN